jgi:predicted small secreted protein
MDGPLTPFWREEMTLKTLKVLGVGVVVFSAGFLSGCATIYGVASDIEEGSRAIRKIMELKDHP